MIRSVEIEDLGRFTGIGPPRISPNGAKIAFVVSYTDLEEDTYRTNIWIKDLIHDNLYQLTGGEKDSHPRWSPDGKRILFLSKRRLEEEEKGNELWSINAEGRGEARLILQRKGNPIQDPKWSPDGDSIAFVSRDKEEKDVKIIEKIPIWANGKGFTYYDAKNVFLVNKLTGQVSQITDEELSVQTVEFSPDGEKIAYVVKAKETKPVLNHLYVKNLEKDTSKKLTKQPMSIRSIAWSPTNDRLALQGHKLPRGSVSHYDIWITSLEQQTMKNITKSIENNTTSSLSFDAGKPVRARQGLLWKKDFIYYQTSHRGRVSLHRIEPRSKQKETLIETDGGVINFDVYNDKVVYTKVDSFTPPEIYKRKNGKETQMTQFNKRIMNEIAISKPHHFQFQASDGTSIDGWIVKPQQMETDHTYPLILEIHGGPKGMYGYGFSHTFQLLSAEGYGVVYFNPRGSDGYSEAFADIREHWGERDYKDIMEGMDHVINTYDWINPEKLGVTGGSYGGFMTNWIVTHTNRFDAAVSEEGISDWRADFGTSDIGFYFDTDHIGGTPWKQPEKYERQSPITYIENVDTPTMLIHALDDYRCYLEQSLEFYNALQVQQKPTKLVLFEKGGHGVSRSGKPSWRIKRFKLILNWFNKYLKEKEDTKLRDIH